MRGSFVQKSVRHLIKLILMMVMMIIIMIITTMIIMMVIIITVIVSQRPGLRCRGTLNPILSYYE